MSSSIKKNFFYSSLLTTANYIFPLLTFPYVTRVLGVTNLGVCGYVDSIVNYFILFAMLGVNIVGIRAVAEKRNSRQELTEIFSSLLSFNLITTLIMMVALIAATLLLPKLAPYREYLFIGVFKIISTTLLAEWFYKGLEDFKYITIRTMVVKMVYVIGIFVFVRTKDDTITYYLLTMLMIAVNSVFNIVHTKNYADFSLAKVRIAPYWKPMLIYGFYFFITSMYTSFNITYLGWTCSDEEVGYYTTATKLFFIIIALFTAFTGVMMPRMTNLLAEGKFSEFKMYLSKSQDLLFTFAVPIILLITIYAPQIVLILAGEGYEGAILPTIIITPLIIVIGLEQILVLQTLNPLKKDKEIIINSTIGALVGLGLNILLVKELKSTGSAIAWLASEIVILISSQYWVTKYYSMKFPFKKLLNNILYNIPLVTLLLLMDNVLELNAWITMLITGTLTLLYTLALQLYLKNEFVVAICKKIGRKNG
ncbi:MAG: flippase [Paludibacteraceae bacterium]|nr:flippase [Paludibacteraceae bacterium]